MEKSLHRMNTDTIESRHDPPFGVKNGTTRTLVGASWMIITSVYHDAIDSGRIGNAPTIRGPEMVGRTTRAKHE